MRITSVLKVGLIASAIFAAALIPAGTASANIGSASGKCVDNVGVITADFKYFGDRSKMLGNIIVMVNSSKVDDFKPTADNFVKTYKPYANGTYNVKASWVLDQNGNKKADQGETLGFENNVTISGCTPKVEKCSVPGKENLPKNDPNCKEDEKCSVAGKTHLPKGHKDCKEDEKCAVAGKTNLPKNDKDCKEVEVPQVLPATGPGSMLMLPLIATIAGTVLYSRRAAKQ